MHEIRQTKSETRANGVRRMWGLSLDSWNNVIVAFLSVGAAAAVIVGIATYIAFQLQKQESQDAHDELERYKLGVAAQVADAKREGIEAGKAAGDALLRAAALEKEAAELKARNLVLEEKIQPRRISVQKSKEMSSILSSIKGIAIVVASRLLDPEGKDFGDDLELAFKNAGWPTARYVNWTMSNKGVFIAAAAGTVIPDEVSRAIAGALEVINTKHTTMTISGQDLQTASPNFQQGVLYLLVGVKPNE